jgi:hypothetical protein
MCQPHWDRLRAAIGERGLSALVADSGEQAVSNFRSQLDHGQTIDNYDPLMAAQNAIVGNGLQLAGLELFADEDDGSERCPICFLTRMHDAHCREPACDGSPFEGWIDLAADDQVEEWKRLGGNEGTDAPPL